MKFSGPAAFYKKRTIVYGAMLLFVVAAGLPMIAVPSLRNRLSDRLMTLRAAVAGEVRPVNLKVGENLEPFPEEFERPAHQMPGHVQLPVPESDQVYAVKPGGVVVPSTPSQPRTIRIEKIRKSPPPSEAPATAALTDAESAAGEEPAADTGPVYKTGKIEQEAYDLLQESNKAIAGMIQGSNPSLHFKSWDAAVRGNSIYWVRVRFASDGNPDVDYIWQVNLDTKQVTPLSYNARSID